MATTKRSEWKSIYEVQLPSGYIVEMRPLGYDMILRCQNVPDVITSMVIRGFKGEDTGLQIDQFAQVRDFAEFLDDCCRLCLVHPTIVDNPTTDDEISADMLSFADKQFIFGTLGQVPRWLENFRPEQTPDVQAGAEERALPDAGEPIAEPEALAANG